MKEHNQKKCKYCKLKKPLDNGIQTPSGWFCSYDHTIKYANDKTDLARIRAQAKKIRDEKKKLIADKERIKKRTGKNGYYYNLRTAIHYYVKHVLRAGEPCYTCGLQQKSTDSPQAFHVGHFIPAKEVDPRRFMLENLRIQCYSCNVPNSGKRAEYKERLIEEIGADHVTWLECEANHKSLKEQYPTIESIKAEIKRYRAMSKA